SAAPAASLARHTANGLGVVEETLGRPPTSRARGKKPCHVGKPIRQVSRSALAPGWPRSRFPRSFPPYPPPLLATARIFLKRRDFKPPAAGDGMAGAEFTASRRTPAPSA